MMSELWHTYNPNVKSCGQFSNYFFFRGTHSFNGQALILKLLVEFKSSLRHLHVS